jgi:hypothetical protein
MLHESDKVTGKHKPSAGMFRILINGKIELLMDDNRKTDK